MALIIPYSRLYFKCHTIQQAIVGGIGGLIHGYYWFKHKSDVYKFINFPWIPEPRFKFKKEETNDKTIYRSENNENFWRTCWNSQYICINHDDPVNFYFSNRFIFIEKKY